MDEERELPHEETEAVVLFDWENGYVECSAKVVFVYRAFQKYVKVNSFKGQFQD